MNASAKAAVAAAGLRIAYGAALLVAPVRAAKPWLGADVARPAAGVALRALGARELVLHAGAVSAALSDRPVRPWLVASIGGDCADIAATFAADGGQLPDGAALKTLAAAGAAAAISAAVLALLDG